MAGDEHFLAILRNRDFLKLYIGQLGSGVGDRLHQMALLGVIMAADPGREFAASGPETARLMFFGMLPVLLFSLLAVAWTDRWSRKLTMVAADSLRAAFAFCIPLIRQWDPSVRALYGVVFVMGTLATFHGPARLAGMPRIAEPRLLMAANSLSNSSGAVAGLLAIPLAGWAVQALGPNPCFVIDGFTFMFSALCIALIARSLKPEGRCGRVGVWESGRGNTLADARAGLAYTLAHREALLLVLLGALFTFVGGVLLVAVLAFATTALGLREAGVGMLISAGGLGMALGLFAVSRSERLKHAAWLPFAAQVAMGACIAAVPLTRSAWVAGLALAAVGAAAALASVPADTRVQEIVPDARRGGVFSVKQLLAAGAFLLALWVQFGSGALQTIAPGRLLTALGAVAVAGGAVLWVMHRAASRETAV
ncbi:MAG: MFS transporter [Verrucomicrobia bacterium]|nr:MFS transporter [Verrucomicrobiota bacterium]